jgi:hypothetical protein
MMHEYKKDDIEACLHGRRLVFIGDSTTRQIFWAVAKKMDQERAEGEMTELLDHAQKGKDLEFTSDGVTVQFVWDPWLNSTGLERELQTFRADPPVPDEGEVDESAALILLGAPGLWYARHGQENFFRDFRTSIDSVIPYMDHAGSENGKLPSSRHFRSRNQSPNFLLLAPVQVPWYEALSPSREETITPEKIDLMNDYLQQVSAYSGADVIWSYSLMTFAGRAQYEESGLHVVDNVAHRKADVLLNLRCNAESAQKDDAFNRTCCSNYKQPNGLQWVILLVGMLLLPGVVFVRRKHLLRIGRLLPPAEVCSALAVLALVVCFCFYADRTQVFEKAHRQFRRGEFLTACLAVAVIGVFSIRKSETPASTSTVPQKKNDRGFLSQDQTAEWRGWMQAFILIYHYTRGSKTLWIYEIVRILIASYIFLTGFDHTLYFLKTDDYSLKRVAAVMLRFNLLSCLLPYMMQTDYLFYYLPPLISFWFLVIYFTLRVGYRNNSNLNFIFAKVIISAILTTAFTMIPGILEFVALLLKYSCGISWDVTEWRSRIFLDMYIAYVGMIMAVLYHRRSQLDSGSIVPRHIINSLLRLTKTRNTLFTTVMVLASVILLPGFWVLTRRSPDQEDYNWWQPYISCVPILSFITLRNCHPVLRTYHSTTLAWLGRYSLDAYVLHPHIWLAGDGHGLLRLGLFNRWIDAAILTPAFLWVSWHAASASRTLSTWITAGCDPDAQDLDVAPPTHSPYPSLPGAQREEGTPSKTFRFSIGDGSAPSWTAKLAEKLRTNLRWRLGLLGLMLWVGNLWYR